MPMMRQLCNSTLWIRALIIFVVIWIFLAYAFFSQSPVEHIDTAKRIKKALDLLEQQKQQNNELRQLLDHILSGAIEKQVAQKILDKLSDDLDNGKGGNMDVHYNDLDGSKSMSPPSIEYEMLRRRIYSNIQEIWNFFSHELDEIRKKTPTLSSPVEDALRLGVEMKRSLLSDMEHLKDVDGYESWRQREAHDLSELVQRRLHHLQNPADCKTARKLLCTLNKGCGYGCQMHHVVYCFIVAYATERTMILRSLGWRYHRRGWEDVFVPVSNSCIDENLGPGVTWPGHRNARLLLLPIIDSMNPRPPYLPMAIPEDLAPRLERLHGHPIVWWIGQFLKYLLRPQPATQQLLTTGIEKIGLKRPFVGIHIRRTDKIGTEAAYHKIEEYMTYAEDYFLTLEMNGTKQTRRVFIASDDAGVFLEARKKFPEYEVLGNPDVARLAEVATRYTYTSLHGIIMDIHMLSIADFLVCTFSSQVCRVAYEIMQTMYADAAHRFKSLDDIYYYGGQNGHSRRVLIKHEARNHDELNMDVGDAIGVAGNHWNGFSKGKNERTNQIGLFPTFKIVDKVDAVAMPKYSQVSGGVNRKGANN